jgi:predicted amidophosphoribosyltransferase
LCDDCLVSLQPGIERRLACGLLVRPAFRHGGAARAMVHHLKYGGPDASGEILATAMTKLLPPGARALVPVPRVAARLWRYGSDPGAGLAAALARRTGLPVVAAIRRPVWWARRAGPVRTTRGRPGFRARRSVVGAVLIDDVLTTGATLCAAAAAVPDALAAVTATAADGPGRSPPPGVS